jgi:CRP-like cAMP-binding protein
VENKYHHTLHTNTSAKKVETFVILGPGEMIGEEALFKETLLPYNVITETECSFYVTDIAKLQKLYQDNKFIKELLTKRVDTKKDIIRRRMQPFMHMIKLLPNQN